jgi:L-2-hydroxyglutarate oxidase
VEAQVCFSAKNVLNCTGLHADRVSVALGGKRDPYLVPVRGDYMKINDSNIVNGLVYPVPNPVFPFLGIHLTKTMSGNVTCGPNAMLAFAREGYTLTDWNWKDLKEMLSKKGLWKVK